MTPTERRALHPAAIVEAWEWIDTYCPHYAITRLAQKLNVLQLARMAGHRDIRSLQTYYNETAESIAALL